MRRICLFSANKIKPLNVLVNNQLKLELNSSLRHKLGTFTLSIFQPEEAIKTAWMKEVVKVCCHRRQSEVLSAFFQENLMVDLGKKHVYVLWSTMLVTKILLHKCGLLIITWQLAVLVLSSMICFSLTLRVSKTI